MNNIRLAEINILIRELQHWGSKEVPYMIELFDYIMELREEAKKAQKNTDFLNEAIAGWARQYDDIAPRVEQMQKVIEWYADHTNFSYAGMNEMYARSMSEKAVEALKGLPNDL